MTARARGVFARATLRAVLAVVLAGGSYAGCRHDDARDSASGGRDGSATGGASGALGGGESGAACIDVYFAAQSRLIDLRVRYEHAPCSSDEDCVLASEVTSCFQSCGDAVPVESAERHAADFAALDADFCSTLIECGLELRSMPVRCPELRVRCTGGCGVSCPGEDEFARWAGGAARCDGGGCETLPGGLPFFRAEHCCTPDGYCGAGSPEHFGGACFPRGSFQQTQLGLCPDETVIVGENAESGAPATVRLVGCCLPTGECGLDLLLFGAGCIERSEVSAAAQQACTTSRPLWPAFEPMACTPPP